MIRRHLALVLALLAGSAPLARAQEHTTSRRPSLVIGGPSALGVLVPLTARLQLRPDLAASRSTFNVGASESKFVNVTIGFSVLLALPPAQALATYLAPRISLTRNTYDDGRITDQWIVDGLYGAHASITPRFGLFGEAGPRVSYSDQSSSAGVNRTTTVTLRGALGATLRF